MLKMLIWLDSSLCMQEHKQCTAKILYVAALLDHHPFGFKSALL